MTAGEWRVWALYDRRTARPGLLPCADCLSGFAAEMRAVGLCTGSPGMTRFPYPVVVLTRSTRAQPLAIRQERRRASWRAYRARVRARKP